MMLHLPQVLSQTQLQDIRQQLQTEQAWRSGQQSAGAQAQKIKHNLQIDPQHAIYPHLNQLIQPALKQHPLYQSFCLPKHLLPLMFNCYQDGGHYGQHVDSAIHYLPHTGQAIRTDLSLTLFLSEYDDYEGGELIIEDTYGSHEVKLDAGDAIIYPATSLHRVAPVTKGKRLAAFSWVQSMVRDDWQRSMLFNLDMSILRLRQALGDHPEVVHLTQHYHNLLRQWGEL